MPDRNLKVALVRPPILGHQYRGTGIYTEQLYEALKQRKDISVELVNLKDSTNDFDTVHFPYFDPFFLTLPLFKKKPVTVTVHDLIPLKFPQKFPPGLRGTFKWLIQKFSLAHSDAILTDSYASKEDIMLYTGLSFRKIDVVYLGVDKEFKIIKTKNFLERVKHKYCLTDDFLLYVGDINYNKNINGLLKGFKLLSASYPDLYLILIGKGFVVDSPQLKSILNLIKDLNLGNKIMRLEYMNKTDLIAVYNLAKIYVQLSFAEGFGLPILEAMACGCPVITSNTGSLAEIAADGSILTDPYNLNDFVKNASNLLNNEDARVKLIKRGLERVKLFTWQNCAEKTVQVYHKIVQS